MTQSVEATPGESDWANVGVFLIAFVVIAIAMWMADQSTATTESGAGMLPPALTSEPTDH